MITILKKKNPGRNFMQPEDLENQIRVSILAGHDSKGLQANIRIGKMIAEELGWEIGDRAEVGIDKENGFIFLKKTNDPQDYQITTAAGAGRHGRDRTMSVKFSIGRGRVPFMKIKHHALTMKHEIENGVLKITYGQ